MDGRIDLERARADAKALLRAARDGDADALARLRRAPRAPRLSDAQHVVARELGARSWPALVRDVEAGDALIAATRAGSRDEVYALLEAGAPANARDADGATALHVAAEAGFDDVVDALVGWVPVDRGARDRSGRTALDLAGDPVVTAMLAPSPVVDKGLGERAWAAEVALFEHRSRLAERRAVGDGFGFRTGRHDNSWNGVVATWAEDVDEVIAWLGAPAQWLAPAGSALRLPNPERDAVFMAAAIAGGGAAEPGGDAPSTPRIAEVSPGRFATDGGHVEVLVAGRTLLVVELFVETDRRRQGLGRTLVRHALREAPGCDVAVLSPTPATIPFYVKLGFTLYRFPPERTFYVR